MKRFISVAIMFIICVATLSAQEFRLKSFDGNIQYAIQQEDGYANNFGFNAGVTFETVKNLDLVPSVSYYIKTKGVYTWDVNADLHYNFHIEQSHKFALYPLIGVTYKVWGTKFKGAEDFNKLTCNKIGFNAGAGAQYMITDTWSVKFEGKYQWFNHKFDNGVIGLGASYHF